MAEQPISARDQLLHAAIEYVAEHGVGDLSLRRLAAAIGTSHRMLIYHFGSKEGVFIAVIRAVEEQQRRTLAAFELDPALSPAEVMRRMWKHLADPALWPNERLFFELYGQALQGRPYSEDLLEGIVERWVEPAAELSIARGVPAELARAHARLGVAIVRGLLLDLLATGDVAGVDAAMDAFIELYERWLDAAGRARPA